MISLKPYSDSECRLLASLCPDECKVFQRWRNRVELYSATIPDADIQHIKTKALTLHHWFDHFINARTPEEAVTMEAN